MTNAITQRPWRTIALVGALALALVACGSAEPVELADGETITVGDNFFEAEHAVVDAGSTVEWDWEGNQPHNVVGDTFESEVYTGQGQFTHTFDDAGTYEYTCTLHHGMDGAIEVR